MTVRSGFEPCLQVGQVGGHVTTRSTSPSPRLRLGPGRLLPHANLRYQDALDWRKRKPNSPGFCSFTPVENDRHGWSRRPGPARLGSGTGAVTHSSGRTSEDLKLARWCLPLAPFFKTPQFYCVCSTCTVLCVDAQQCCRPRCLIPCCDCAVQSDWTACPVGLDIQTSRTF